MNAPLGALAGAAVLLMAVPVWLLAPGGEAPTPARAAPAPIVPSAAVALDAALARDPFAAGGEVVAEPAREAADDDAPVVAGIVGRLPDHAVVLVRRAGGGTRALAPGESVAGWRLDAISGDAALFVRGARRVRVGVAAE